MNRLITYTYQAVEEKNGCQTPNVKIGFLINYHTVISVSFDSIDCTSFVAGMSENEA